MVTAVSPARTPEAAESGAPTSEGHVLVHLTGEAPAPTDVSVNSLRLVRSQRLPEGAFRDFEADIEQKLGDVSSVVGTIKGRFSWLAWLPELVDDGGTVGRFAELIAAALDVGNRLNTEAQSEVAAVVMIDRVSLATPWTNALGRRVAEQLIDLFLLTPESTLFLVHLGPEANPVGTLLAAAGPEPSFPLPVTDVPADFERWGSSNTWWMRASSADR